MNSSPGLSYHIDIAELKQRLNECAEEFARHLFPAGKKLGSEWVVGSVAGEAGKSLRIRIGRRKVGVWSDFATGETGGNLLELYVQTQHVSCAEAIKRCVAWLETSNHPHNETSQKKGHTDVEAKGIYPSQIYQPTELECSRVMSMVGALRDNPTLCEQVAADRHWLPSTIRNLALEAYLGWEQGNLAFMYDTGVKLRRQVNGTRTIWWALGKPWIWRGAYLEFKQVAYVCEGETDAIALIDAGLEEQEANTIAVAIPSASTFKPEWAQLFKGKDVILALDADAAGQAATERIGGLLDPVASSIKTMKWETPNAI